MLRTPPINKESDRTDDEFFNQPPVEQGLNGLQNEDTRRTTGFSQSGGYGDTTDQAAAETLVHFRDQTPHESNRTIVAINGDANGQQERSMQYCSTGFWQPRSGNNNNLNPQQLAPHTQDSSNSMQNSVLYSDSNLKVPSEVLAELSVVYSSIRLNYSLKQENFAGALQNVVAVLQEMRTVALTNNQNEAGSMFARLTLPNEAPQTPNWRWCRTVPTLASFVKEIVLFHICRITNLSLGCQVQIVKETWHKMVASFTHPAILLKEKKAMG